MTQEKVLPSLKAMAEAHANGVQKTTQFQVDPREIEVEPGFNARPIDPEHVASMKESARAGMGFPPLVVRVQDGRIILIDGHHRLQACLELIAEGTEYKRIDVMQFRGNDAERIALMLTSAQGKPLLPLQAGFQYKKLVALGWSVAEVAAKVGKTRQHVDDMIRLANANTDVHEAVSSGKASANTALAAVRKHGDKAGKVLKDAHSKSGGKKVTKKTLKGDEPKRGVSAEIEARIRAEERERCATLCDEFSLGDVTEEAGAAAEVLAEKIRELS